MKNLMRKIIVVIFIFFVVVLPGCSNKFDKAGWAEQTDVQYYPNRNKMLNDLLTNYKLKGISYTQLTDLLGNPEKNWTGEKGEIFYPIITKYGTDIDPVYTKTLIFRLDTDSVVVDYKINEWKK